VLPRPPQECLPEREQFLHDAVDGLAIRHTFEGQEQIVARAAGVQSSSNRITQLLNDLHLRAREQIVQFWADGHRFDAADFEAIENPKDCRTIRLPNDVAFHQHHDLRPIGGKVVMEITPIGRDVWSPVRL
jgi:hypothetical protein